VATEAVLEGHYVLGVEGLALLRAGAERRFERVEDRVREIARVAQLLDEGAYSERRDLPEHGVDTGYAGRAESYYDPGNDTVALEEPVVRASTRCRRDRYSTRRVAPGATWPTSSRPGARS